MKKLVVILMLSFGLAVQVSAMQSPQALVQATSEKMLAKLKADKQLLEQDPGRIYELVNKIVLPHFDFEYMSQLVLAKYWRRASAEQRHAFTAEFRTLLVRTYAKSLSAYTDQAIDFLPFREVKGDDVTVRTEVEQPGSFPIPIDYRLHQRGGEWQVFDIIIDGVSLVTSYRSSFSREIRKAGIDGLIEKLAQRNKDATGG